MSRKFISLAIIAVFLFTLILFLKFQNITGCFLQYPDSSFYKIFLLVSAGALVDSINPCAFSVFLLTIGFFISIGRSRKNFFKLGALYILGLFLVYIFIGIGILKTFYFFNAPNFMAKLGAGFLIIFGAINVMQALFRNFPIRLKIPQFSHYAIVKLLEKASAPAVFVLGVLIGLCEFPCTGGPYLMVLGLLHDKANFLKGLIYLVYYNAIFILPLVIILIIVSNKEVLNKIENWQKQKAKKLRLYTGLIMVVLGIIIFLL